MKIKIPKICFFDMEGTLLVKNHDLDNGKVAPSAWTTLAKEIHEECYLEEERTKEKWLAGGYSSYTEWMYESILIQKRWGLSEKIFNDVIRNSKIQDGAKELVSFLHNNDVITVLISGGFKKLADQVQISLKIMHAYSACEYFFNEDGILEHFNLLPTDEEGKLVFMKHIADEYAVGLDECLFIGDGKNDVHLASAVGTSIAFNAQPELDEVSDISIHQPVGQEDLKCILDFFE